LLLTFFFGALGMKPAPQTADNTKSC